MMDLISMEKVHDAQSVLKESPLIHRTPVLNTTHILKDTSEIPATWNTLNLKLESTQQYGSFKIRGVVNQFSQRDDTDEGRKLFTFSAGNYGRAFAAACHKLNLPGHVLLPNTAPTNRIDIIKSYGLSVSQVPVEDMIDEVDRLSKEMTLSHSFDDVKLIHGYGSVGLEIIEDCPDVDIVITGCGGGGFLAGVSYTIKQLKPAVRVYGIEPETANVMYRSFQAGEPVKLPSSKSIASGLSPPYVGEAAYAICKHTVDDMILVNEAEIKDSSLLLYKKGLVVEPAGAAGLAALINNKIPDVENKNIVIVITGSNVTPEEYISMMSSR